MEQIDGGIMGTLLGQQLFRSNKFMKLRMFEIHRLLDPNRARTGVRIFGKGQNSDLEAKLGQNKVRIWFKSQNNGFFVKDNERMFLFVVCKG